MDYSNYFTQFPDEDGEFAGYGGAYLPPPLIPVFAEITAAYQELAQDEQFLEELRTIRKHYQGRPTSGASNAGFSRQKPFCGKRWRPNLPEA